MKSDTDASSSDTTKTTSPSSACVTPSALVNKEDAKISSSQTLQGSSSDRRLVDPSKSDVVHYNYKGGQTAVMTGGVMLGLGTTSQKGASPFQRKNSANEGGAKKALSRGKGSYNAGGVGKKFGQTTGGSDSADWRKQ